MSAPAFCPPPTFSAPASMISRSSADLPARASARSAPSRRSATWRMPGGPLT